MHTGGDSQAEEQEVGINDIYLHQPFGGFGYCNESEFH
jgi:hypothetical protein